MNNQENSNIYIEKIAANASRFLLNIDVLPIYPSPARNTTANNISLLWMKWPIRVSSGWRLKSAGSGWTAI
jgi:hypothetical protein